MSRLGMPFALAAFLSGGLAGSTAWAASPPASLAVPPSATTPPSPAPFVPEPSPPPPAAPPAQGSAPVAAAPAGEPASPPQPVPVIDATPAASDHDAVGARWGVVVRPVAATLSVTRPRSATGCPTAVQASDGERTCPSVSVASLSARRWLDRTLAVDVGLALALGGGRENGQLLDTYFGFGPVIGTSILLANWKHLAVAASPELGVLIFKPSGSARTAYVADLSANVEAELHFGFIGAPALSVGIRSGLSFRLEHADAATLWSVGAAGTTTISALFHDVALRYYF